MGPARVLGVPGCQDERKPHGKGREQDPAGFAQQRRQPCLQRGRTVAGVAGGAGGGCGGARHGGHYNWALP
ncbi:hypothetical protein ANDA3_1316 [plant metagenome]|uniref:Uncharacterized protein n=1 Tax=plant metagenome TaxID=1297885 RepID=A0A484P1M5_9ZZZZ